MVAALGCSTGAESETFTATLNQGNETAGGATVVGTDGSGTATGSITLTYDGVAVATYKLTVNGLTNITAAHIHSATAGTATNATGPISVYLFDGPATGTTAFSGTLGCTPPTNSCTSSFNQVQITAGAGTGAVNTMDGLMNNIRNHLAYVNVHTTANTGGAIRGNF
jgi:hypothetical protein